MTFVCTLYILIIVFAENKGSVFKETEVVHLSRQLYHSECFPLLKSAYELIPEGMEHDKTNYEVLNKDLNCFLTTSKMYLTDLERWTNDYPNRKESGRRSTMQLTRKLLEHSDLLMYMKENQRPVNLMDAEDYHLANVLEFPEHKAVRRSRSKNKHLSNKEKKKKNAYKIHPERRKTQKKRTHGATGHAVAHKTHKLKKKENKPRDTKCYLRQHQSLCISILFVLLFIVLCLVAAYYLHKRSRLKARGTRFKYNWAENKEDKDTLTDYVEWNDEAVCSCSDGDIGRAIKCPICNRIYQTSSNISNKYVSSLGAQKSKDKEKKKRFSFLRKSFQDKKKEKNRENRDWKKVGEKSILKNFQEDPQCACCKCDLHIRDKMIREKKENKRKVLQKLKAKKCKEKKRRKDEKRKSEKCANMDDAKANICNPDHKESGPGHKSGYQGVGDKADLDNHSIQLDSKNPKYNKGDK